MTVCACEPGYTCSRCKGTPADPFYEDDAAEPRDVDGKEGGDE